MAFGGATLAACPLSALVLSFAFYGFCGWAWESTVCAMLNQGRFANSGFLLGPCCPIYGVGGIACWLLLRGIPDASGQFVAAALVCSVIEYSVGLLLEKTTGARFWDYSHLPFNLHGRISRKRQTRVPVPRVDRRQASRRQTPYQSRFPPSTLSSFRSMLYSCHRQPRPCAADGRRPSRTVRTTYQPGTQSMPRDTSAALAPAETYVAR